MTTETPQRTQLETVEGMYKAVQAGDFEGALERLHPDVVLHEADSIPYYGGEHTGRKAFVENVAEPMFEHYDPEIHDVSVFDAGAVVVARLDVTFTSKSTGKAARMPIVELSQVTDGLIRHMDIYYKDSALMAETFPEGEAG